MMNHKNFKPTKKLGQNFLIDQNIADKIIDISHAKGENVLEIGPGTGALTLKLSYTAHRLVAVELDNALCDRLKKMYLGKTNVEIVKADIMKIDIDKLMNAASSGDAAGFIVVANIPYYITTPIIMKLLENRSNLKRLVIMVQREVAERIVAPPGGKDYGALSVAVQYYADPRIELNVSKKSFYPVPKVDSSVVRMDIRPVPKVMTDERLFFKIVRAAFSGRRKMLLNALSTGLSMDKNIIKKVLASSGINGERRGETLAIEEFALIADKIKYMQDI